MAAFVFAVRPIRNAIDYQAMTFEDDDAPPLIQRDTLAAFIVPPVLTALTYILFWVFPILSLKINIIVWTFTEITFGFVFLFRRFGHVAWLLALGYYPVMFAAIFMETFVVACAFGNCL